MIKLIKNELIKIFKRKSIYVLLIASLIAMIIYNYMNPDQNPTTLKMNTNDLDTSSLERDLENTQNNISEENTDIQNTESDVKNELQEFLQNLNNDVENLISKNVSLEFAKLYNRYKTESWQRYALNEERNGYSFENNSNLPYNQDIYNNIKIIKDYELNPNTQITEEQYNKSIKVYNGYIEALDSNNWKQYILYKIQCLKEEQELDLDNNFAWIQIEIDINQLRLENNIKYEDDKLNEYIEQYRGERYYLQNYVQLKDKNNFIEKQIEKSKGKVSLLEYAIENNISQDISSESYNIITENKIDARISFIRTFEHFDLIIIIIAIYISCMIVTEEINKKTIKNLLAKPHKRSTILISKMIACIITIIISIIFICITQYVVGGLIYGFDSYHLGYIGYDYNTEQAFTMNVGQFIILEALAKLPMYVLVILFCIFMGTINNNTSMTMILTLITFIVASSVLAEWSKVESLANIFKYFITNNWDFSTYLFGNFSEIPGINLEFSIVVYAIYFILLIAASIKIFSNKEINNKS